MISSESYFHCLFSGFATNKTELNAVFDIFDKDNKYYMQYSEFIEALKPDRHVSTKNYEF
jgi:Ca2+-binding EF-hand superfamily protein